MRFFFYHPDRTQNLAAIALKVDVDTLRGTREGVPRLVDLLSKQNVGATFLFSLGPDHTGRAIQRALRPGFLKKVRRTSVVKHYGFPTLLYGTLLPGPDIGKACEAELRKVRDCGFETGIHAWDHVGWQNNAAAEDVEWTHLQFSLAQERYHRIFNEPAKTHGAAGWQMPKTALRVAASFGFDYCTDGRTLAGEAWAHYPVFDGEVMDCPQLPTDLPTFDELIGNPGCTESNVHESLLQRTRVSHPETGGSSEGKDHVFTLHAELEGLRLLSEFEKLIVGWKNQGYRLISTRSLFEDQARKSLPYFRAMAGEVPGRSGSLLITGGPYPGSALQ